MNSNLDDVFTKLTSKYKVQDDLVEVETQVHIEWVNNFGWFEQVISVVNSDIEDVIGGSLWFSRDEGKFTLHDYDGVYELPFAVVQSLKTLDNVGFEEFIIPDVYYIRPVTLDINREDIKIYRQNS